MESSPNNEILRSSHPLPGPAPIRPIWDGEKETPPPVYSPPPEPTELRWSKDLAFGPARSPLRITGLDAARGCALFGMIAVHLLPAFNEYTGRPTFIWEATSGRAAALFAVLAGVSIALITGANNPHSGQKMRRARVSLTTRASIILLIGLAIDELDLSAYNILPYYGLMFFFALPFVTARVRTLLSLAAVFVIAGPLVVFFTNARIEFTTTYNPNFTALFRFPVDTLLTLLVGGTYPVITWMPYILVGMAIGRLNLRWLLTQLRLIVLGSGLAVLSEFTSTVLVDYAGGFSNLYYYTDGYEIEDIVNVFDFGPEDHLPTDTWWWLTVTGPHTDTTFDLLTCTGLALLIIGASLVVSRMLSSLLYPLIAAGSMTLTLYAVHLVLFAFFTPSIENHPIIWFFAQIAVALLSASAWLLIFKKGPLETVVSNVCHSLSHAFVPEPPEPVIVKDH